MGYSRDVGERVLALPSAVSIAVLPFTPQATALAAHAQAIGMDVLLHQRSRAKTNPSEQLAR